ncbi:hypothetical protein EVAR_67007_1 [Eumeta japonica]|uniref:Uncharacterized protein n=1 Tax=Eumeta variegata TaxID=151549 RepID=A0A4C1ZSQ3_EUMVA|nr:hypothetical protein EVAR_67007_1 [Eumeta japonica]
MRKIVVADVGPAYIARGEIRQLTQKNFGICTSRSMARRTDRRACCAGVRVCGPIGDVYNHGIAYLQSAKRLL